MEEERQENRGRPLDEESVAYPRLLKEIRAAGLSIPRVCRKMGVAQMTILHKLKGRREWKLWECIAIKRIIGSDLPLEELFQKKGDAT